MRRIWNPLAWLARRWRDHRAYRRLIAEADPRTILRMSREIRALAEAAAQSCPGEELLQSRIRSIQDEMSRLGRLAQRSEFRRLSPGKRILLRQGLTQSREQLLETLQTAPAPTRLLQ